MGTLRIGMQWSAPPFGSLPGRDGLDVEVMTALAEAVGDRPELVVVDDAVARLAAGDVDCASATVTAERAPRLEFLPPYVVTGQGLATDRRRLPDVVSVDDLAGRTIAVEQGDTAAEALAAQLVADGRAGGLRRYAPAALDVALRDLGDGGCDAVLARTPALVWHLRGFPEVAVVQRGLTVEQVAIAAARDGRAGQLRDAQAVLEADGTLQRLRRSWLGSPFTDQSLRTL